jgi:hypothetical protein
MINNIHDIYNNIKHHIYIYIYIYIYNTPTIPEELDTIKHNDDGRKRAKRVGILYVIVSNYSVVYIYIYIYIW